MLKIPSGDRIILNGAVLENVGRGARLRVLTPNTQLLRLRDAVDPKSADTPVGRIAQAVQLMLLEECDVEQVSIECLTALQPLHAAFLEPEDRLCVLDVAKYVKSRNFYQALRLLGQLRRREAAILSRAAA